MLTAGRGTVTIFHVVSYLYSEGKINLHTNLDLTQASRTLALCLPIKALSFQRLADQLPLAQQSYARLLP